MCANSKSSADERITNAHYLTQGYVIFQAAVQCRSEAGGPWERDHVEETREVWSAVVQYSHVT